MLIAHADGAVSRAESGGGHAIRRQSRHQLYEWTRSIRHSGGTHRGAEGWAERLLE